MTITYILIALLIVTNLLWFVTIIILRKQALNLVDEMASIIDYQDELQKELDIQKTAIDRIKRIAEKLKEEL